MRKNILWALALLLPLMGLVSSCSSNEEIVFDHEKAQFETQADKILLEVIAPAGTSTDDDLYIVGDFNGGSENAVGNEAWKLMKAPNSTMKWGIYLTPSSFEGGKTLANGYYFYSTVQREERTIKGDSTLHYDNPAVGTRTNIWVNRWAAYYDSGSDEDEEVEHDGFAVFVDDQTGWDALTMYMWGDVNNLNGDWPGMNVTGMQKKSGIRWKYFDFGAGNTGLNENLIFNNGGNGVQLADFNFTIDRDLYLRITADGVEEVEQEPTVQHDGYALFVLNQSSQTDLALYAWGDAEAFGGWPGMPATGTQKINGNEYVYFDLGNANTGLNLHLIPNNNNGGVQWEGDDLFFTIDHDIYVRIFDGGYEVIDKDYKPGDTPTPEPDPEPQPAGKQFAFYVNNQTGWDGIALYAWGDGIPELFGGWPGNNSPATKSVAGTDYLEFAYTGEGLEYHLIFNNNGGGQQFDGPVVNIGNDFYYNVTASECQDITRKIYIDDQTGWGDAAVYAWGDGIAELYGGWPGKNVYGTETIDGVTYKVFTFPATGQTYNPIFNNNGGGSQCDGPAITLDKDYFFTVTANGWTAKARRR